VGESVFFLRDCMCAKAEKGEKDVRNNVHMRV